MKKLRGVSVLICLSTVFTLTSCQKDEEELLLATPVETTSLQSTTNNPEACKTCPTGKTLVNRQQTKTGPLYNQRYCEVLVTKFEIRERFSLDVYNTVGCSTCPEDDWNALNSNDLKKEFKSPYVRLNGPRHWVLDSIYSSTINANCDTAFGNLDMSLVANIPIALTDISTEIAYQVNIVERNTEWHYFKGTQVYILQDPTEKCFIMQSYSQKIDPLLTIEELENLGNRLNLPEGWSYKTVFLQNDFVLESQDGFAELVTDELENAYQYLHNGCL